jgi:hypothetical protein
VVLSCFLPKIITIPWQAAEKIQLFQHFDSAPKIVKGKPPMSHPGKKSSDDTGGARIIRQKIEEERGKHVERE